MIRIDNKFDCSGCGACRDICPVNAIELSSDQEGFMYPAVDSNKCVKCGRCVSVCPVKNPNFDRPDSEVNAYAVQTQNEKVRLASSSGGFFTEIATYVLNQKGVVFGAAFDENFCVKHSCVDRIDDLDKLRGSKYVQSEIGTSYREAKSYLDEGRLVLFTGTPCQVGGLLSYLGRDYDNLITQDIICHGVPSPIIWKKYVEYREEKAAAKLWRTFFRHKKYGWKMYSVQFQFSNGTEYLQTLSEDLYMRSFLNNLSLRPSCYACAFKTKFRESDFTLADFWGIEHVCPEMDDNKGTSLVILHSEKARKLYENIKCNLIYQEVNLDEAIKYNSAMLSSVAPEKNRDAFFRAVNKKGFRGAKKYVKISFFYRLKSIVKRVIKKIVIKH